VPLCIHGCHKVFLKSIQQLQRNSNIALNAYYITNQGPKLRVKVSDRKKLYAHLLLVMKVPVKFR
jgi:hypothetical protein